MLVCATDQLCNDRSFFERSFVDTTSASASDDDDPVSGIDVHWESAASRFGGLLEYLGGELKNERKLMMMLMSRGKSPSMSDLADELLNDYKLMTMLMSRAKDVDESGQGSDRRQQKQIKKIRKLAT